MPNSDPDGYQWPDIFLAADPAAAVAAEPSEHRLCADALMGWALCMGGVKPCPMFGDVIAHIAIRLDIGTTQDSFIKWSKDNPLSLAQNHLTPPPRIQRQELGPAPASEPATDAVLALAAIICEVDGSHNLGAHRLAKAILAHPASRWQPAALPTGLFVEPPGCPSPGACGCPMERSPDPGLVRLLQRATAELPADHSLAKQIGFALEGWGVAAAPPDRSAAQLDNALLEFYSNELQ